VASQAKPAPTSRIGAPEPTFSNAQPWVVTNAPEVSELTAITANMKKLIAP